MTLTTGIVLQSGKYLISRISHRSKLGITLEGIQMPSRPVILKTLNPELRSTAPYATIKGLFTDRVSQFARCQHPVLEHLIDQFEEHDVPFAVTDCIGGKTLTELVATEGKLAETTAIRYIQQLGAAVKSLHQNGLIHGSISPLNVIQPPGSNIVVLVNFDFSGSDVINVNGNDRSVQNHARSPQTNEYAAIEHYQPHPLLTPATDIYALAGVLYFLVTGHAPVAAPLRHHREIVPPREFCSSLNPALETAILHGLALHPQARPTTIANWLLQLTTAMSAPSAIPSKVPPQPIALPAAFNASAQPSIVSASEPSTSQQPMISLPASKRFSSVLLTTAAIAAAIGIGTGLALRLAATTTGPGASFFHAEQAFPVLEGWPGANPPIPEPTATIPLSPVQPRSVEPVASPPVPVTPPVQETTVLPEADAEPPASPAPVEPIAPASEPAPSPITPVPVAQPDPLPDEPLPPPAASPSPLPVN